MCWSCAAVCGQGELLMQSKSNLAHGRCGVYCLLCVRHCQAIGRSRAVIKRRQAHSAGFPHSFTHSALSIHTWPSEKHNALSILCLHTYFFNSLPLWSCLFASPPVSPPPPPRSLSALCRHSFCRTNLTICHTWATGRLLLCSLPTSCWRKTSDIIPLSLRCHLHHGVWRLKGWGNRLWSL